MPIGYTYVLSETASEFAFRLPIGEQKRLAYACRLLAQKPFSEGDYATTDSAGRRVQNLLRDDWVFSYFFRCAPDRVHDSTKKVLLEILDGGP